MSQFIKLGPCPHCGSRDNRAEYTNGFWCFGCSKYESKDDTKSIRQRVFNKDISKDINNDIISTTQEIPMKAMQWLLKYNITLDEIKRYGIKWEPIRKLLVLIERKNYWQGRNFGFGKIKYMSSGNKPLTIYGKGDKLLVVEDVLSAIKIARLRQEGYCATPLLGSSMNKQAEQQLLKRYENISVWLDRDKAKNAIRIRNRLRSLGVSSRAIITPLDPKEYNRTEILEWLKS
tara:strand:- start:3796 stop:4491 length:696 start_codon:yes stop_codon:yes gene_type:complete